MYGCKQDNILSKRLECVSCEKSDKCQDNKANAYRKYRNKLGNTLKCPESGTMCMHLSCKRKDSCEYSAYMSKKLWYEGYEKDNKALLKNIFGDNK